MDRPAANDPITYKILDEMEAGRITPTDAKMLIPDNEKISTIEYILFWEDRLAEKSTETR